MPWIKRNLVFVISLAVAAVLLGVGVAYLLNNKGQADNVNAQLEGKNSELNRLINRNPFPNDQNIQSAKQEQIKLEAILESCKPHFTVSEVPTDLDNASFKNLLESTIDTLTRKAKRSGVRLPEDKFSFTFEEQRLQLQLPKASLEPLVNHLLDIKTLCNLMFDAKIHSLTYIKRPLVGTNETVSATSHITAKGKINDITQASVTPYEVTFNCFSAELASVLNKIVASPVAISIKYINVRQGSLDQQTPSDRFGGTYPGGMDPALAARYGMPSGGPGPGGTTPDRYGGGGAGGGRYGAQPGGGRYGAAPPRYTVPGFGQSGAPKPGDPVLDDKPIRVTLGLEIVKEAAPGSEPDTAQDFNQPSYGY
jgi:hypothetical protein